MTAQSQLAVAYSKQQQYFSIGSDARASQTKQSSAFQWSLLHFLILETNRPEWSNANRKWESKCTPLILIILCSLQLCATPTYESSQSRRFAGALLWKKLYCQKGIRFDHPKIAAEMSFAGRLLLSVVCAFVFSFCSKEISLCRLFETNWNFAKKKIPINSNNWNSIESHFFTLIQKILGIFQFADQILLDD